MLVSEQERGRCCCSVNACCDSSVASLSGAVAGLGDGLAPVRTLPVGDSFRVSTRAVRSASTGPPTVGTTSLLVKTLMSSNGGDGLRTGDAIALSLSEQWVGSNRF